MHHHRHSSLLRVLQQRIGGLFNGNPNCYPISSSCWGGEGSVSGAGTMRFAPVFGINQRHQHMEFESNVMTDRVDSVGSFFVHGGGIQTLRTLASGESEKHRHLLGKLERWLCCRSEHTLSREWLIQRAKMDKKRKEMKQKKASLRRIKPLGTYRAEVGEYAPPVYYQTVQLPTSQALRGPLTPHSPEELKLASVLARPILMITRNIEWANIAFGFEQQNRYVILDPLLPQAPVGYIFEESNWLLRQILRTRRPLTAYVLDGAGNEAFRARRPAWLISGTTYVEVDGKVIGEVHRRWHLWKRVYDLYVGKEQFGYVENPGFWYWTFSILDENGNILAEIDRNWRGFGYELFTDAGQYVVRFGDLPSLEQYRSYSTDQTSVSQVDSLPISRPLNLLERAAVLALAVSLDIDYFSRHVMGWGVPFPMVGEHP